MTQTEILQEFKRMSIRQQLETLKAALEIVESNFEDSQKSSMTELQTSVVAKSDDSLLALAGSFQAEMTDISEKHDRYLGQNIKDDHG